MTAFVPPRITFFILSTLLSDPLYAFPFHADFLFRSPPTTPSRPLPANSSPADMTTLLFPKLSFNTPPRRIQLAKFMSQSFLFLLDSSEPLETLLNHQPATTVEIYHRKRSVHPRFSHLFVILFKDSPLLLGGL